MRKTRLPVSRNEVTWTITDTVSRRKRPQTMASTTSCLVATALAALASSGGTVAGQTPSAASTFKVPQATYTPPKTPWGDPDLQGVYDNRGGVPMERPANLAGKRTFTDAEMAARRAAAGGGGGDLCAPWKKDDASCKNAALSRLDNVGGYNSFWGEGQGQIEDNRKDQEYWSCQFLSIPASVAGILSAGTHCNQSSRIEYIEYNRAR